MGETHSRTDDLIEQEYRTLRKEGRNQALREVLELIEAEKEEHWTTANGGHFYYACDVDSLKTKVEERIKKVE